MDHTFVDRDLYNSMYRDCPATEGPTSLMYMQQVKLKSGCGRTWRNWQQGESRATTTVRQSLRNTSTPQLRKLDVHEHVVFSNAPYSSYSQGFQSPKVLNHLGPDNGKLTQPPAPS